MNKVSKPAERTAITQKSAEDYTKLEMIMPTGWSSFVRHQCSDHTVDTLEDVGVFSAGNMLDHERMHTKLKELARSKKDLMASVVNHYAFMEMSMSAHLQLPGPESAELALLPRTSTPAGYLALPASALRAEEDLDISMLGVTRSSMLNNDDLAEVKRLWRIAEPEYEDLWIHVARQTKKVPRKDAIFDPSEIPGAVARYQAISDFQLKCTGMTPAVKVIAS
jgi:hypothetical protein